MTKPSRPWWPAALLAAAAFGALAAMPGCSTFQGVNSLRGSDAATVDQVPDAKPYAGKRPGSGGQAVLIARNYQTQPPLVPHAIDNFDEITVAENQCMECHSMQKAAEKKAPRVGDSHLIGGGPSAQLRMDRYQCNTCHVPQVDAKPLVASTFSGAAKK
ncbi:MAG: nitrate reductase cytochrome c-type subunit [Betaproteobacteria bacterium]|nr:nitrate reductase cytochrome c-type subunit [Betaproteobacteria bacterium]MCC6246516.1 nitrate reductase cytochrome c-type subunit [Rubrivivax sp.]MCL4696847.1 nitrate reductase cytochrome c-type subunit [Burkholderiaceae bacterium]